MQWVKYGPIPEEEGLLPLQKIKQLKDDLSQFLSTVSGAHAGYQFTTWTHAALLLQYQEMIEWHRMMIMVRKGNQSFSECDMTITIPKWSGSDDGKKSSVLVLLLNSSATLQNTDSRMHLLMDGNITSSLS